MQSNEKFCGQKRDHEKRKQSAQNLMMGGRVGNTVYDALLHLRAAKRSFRVAKVRRLSTLYPPTPKLRSVQVSHTYCFCDYTNFQKVPELNRHSSNHSFLQLLQSRHRSYITHTNLIKLHQKSSRRTHDQIDFFRYKDFRPKTQDSPISSFFSDPQNGCGNIIL